MGDKMQVELDHSEVRKAVLALQAFLKTKSAGKKLFTDDSQKISLLFTLWRIPKEAQTIRIPLPHGQRTASEEVCLFTRDEPQMTADQTERFYKKLMTERGVKNVTEIIPFKVLKTEYKPFEAKRRLLGNFDMFLSDDRIRRRLPSHIGKHFYERKKEPLSVNLQSKNLARDIQKLVQGTSVRVNNKGSCCMARVGHSGMTADELTENIEAAVQTLAEKIRMKGPVLKIVHLKSEKSVALPIYTSDLSHLIRPKATEAEKQPATEKTPKDTKETSAEDGEEKAKKRKVEEKEENDDDKEEKEDDEEIPQLVPIVTEGKKPQLQRKKTRSVEKKHSSILLKMTKKATTPKGKGKVPKVK
ncbi:ribosomal L1 domain-containing protein 1 isoform X1 [Phyllopteryx taeniolatus]|uniref:ribosomal L1 domain-containing protein 1 isoform X1 n=1 Tax=Phyllopteryx taeniolatus TaxID=161469 RepID=UPI002AD2125F|nr:ribosomal L1 domain-containing protein 1 isoform X1 [Phyllopteryx taeniolatus]